ncbi:hypothetical protein C3L33_15880, partial [Rhododendron williamsianum]
MSFMQTIIWCFVLCSRGSFFDGFPELFMTVTRLAVFYKQRDLYFYPAWSYAIPSTILKVPLSLLEALIWTSLTYYVIGYSPEPGRLILSTVILLFAVHFVAISKFRFVASVCRTMVASIAVGSLLILSAFSFSGFVIPKGMVHYLSNWSFGKLLRKTKFKPLVACSLYANLVELGILGFPIELCGALTHSVKALDISLKIDTELALEGGGTEQKSGAVERLRVRDCSSHDQGRLPHNFPMKTLMVTVTKYSVAHTLRDGNQVADALAKMGYEQDVKLITLVTAPDEVLDMLAADGANWGGGWLMGLRSNPSEAILLLCPSYNSVWKMIWKCRIPPEIEHFRWNACNVLLATEGKPSSES